MKYHYLLATLGLLLASQSIAQSAYWRDESGNPKAETDAMKSSNGFAGSLLATTDEDWQKKWNTPPESKPNFNRADAIFYGKKVFILSFFANPKPDDAGVVNVRCDFTITAPTGAVTLRRKDMTCFSGRLKGGPYNMHLSEPVIAFSADPGDPLGVWTVQVNLRDGVRNVELALRTSFRLE